MNHTTEQNWCGMKTCDLKPSQWKCTVGLDHDLTSALLTLCEETDTERKTFRFSKNKSIQIDIFRELSGLRDIEESRERRKQTLK